MKLKLIHKLLIALFVCTALVLVLITLITRASIGRGFVDFLQQQERSKVEQLVPEMANWYSVNKSWEAFERNPRRFHDLISATLGGRETQADDRRPPLRADRPGQRGERADSQNDRPRREGPRDGRGDRRGDGSGGQRPPGPPPGARDGLHQRIFLLDADQIPVVGEFPLAFDVSRLMAIESEGAVVGFLGVVMQRGIELPEEEAFIRQLRDNLLVGLGIGLAVAALLAWILARHLSRPVNTVAGGIRSLASGDFGIRLEMKGSDEIARLGEDVNRLSGALREHETARKRWMSDMAHELRTPLAIIRGELEAMADGVRPLNAENLGSVQDEVKNLSALVDDLHKLALTDSGALAYKMRSVDLDELVQLAVGSFESQATQKDLQLDYGSPGRRINIQGDDQRLRQLFRNLLDNAIRYTDSGGRISMALEEDAQQAKLTISDTKPGATSEQCERLFERLYRLEGSRNRNSGGSGLGLAICRNIVEAHGGNIIAEPGPDGGLLITTTFPLEK